VVSDFYRLVFEPRNTDLIDQFVGDTFIDHNPRFESGKANLVKLIKSLPPGKEWYNHQHHHSGLGLMTPAMVHHGQVPYILAHRKLVLEAAYSAHPERFVRKPPQPPELPSQVWINRRLRRKKLLKLSCLVSHSC